MFFSGFSYQHHHQPGSGGGSPGDATAGRYDDVDHNLTVLLTFGIFFSFILLYLVAGVVWASAITAGAVALSICYLKVRRRRAALRREEAALRAPAGGGVAGVSVVSAAIPAFAYKREGAGAGGGDATGWAQCVICLGLVQVGEVVRRLPACKHLFHVECIDMWLRSHSTCPICRADVVEPADSQPEQEPEPPV
jgi:E3 ubiquitin-protein ligase ATL41